ncbi:MAG: CopC domain [Pseudonocardiales bacterium]|nr:CopC domain [Pseudonocardiales bacterium]
MPHPPVSAVRRAARALPVALVLVIVALAGATPAWAGGSAGGSAGGAGAPTVHHVLPENGAVLRTAPDHVEVMVDVDLVPGQVDVAVAPDATGQLVELPGPPVLDGPLLVQPLPPLPPGRYTVGLQIRGAGGQVARGTFGFAVDPSAPADVAGTPDGGGPDGGTPDGGGPAAWLLPVAATALLVPAGALAVARRLRRRRPAPGGVPAGPGRAAGRTPTSTSSPAARRGR